jgi:hypothetical protein
MTTVEGILKGGDTPPILHLEAGRLSITPHSLDQALDGMKDSESLIGSEALTHMIGIDWSHETGTLEDDLAELRQKVSELYNSNQEHTPGLFAWLSVIDENQVAKEMLVRLGFRFICNATNASGEELSFYSIHLSYN